MAALRRHYRILGIATVASKTYQRSRGTLRSESSLAQFTLAAAIDSVDCDTIARFYPGYAGSYFENLAGKLMTEHKGN